MTSRRSSARVLFAAIVLAILPVLRARTGPAVAALTAMTLCFGYSIAAVGPWILGLAHDLTGSWTVPLLVLIGMTAAELLVGVPATRDWTVGEPGARRVLR